MVIQFTYEDMDRCMNWLQGGLPTETMVVSTAFTCVDVLTHEPHLAPTLHLITHGVGQQQIQDQHESNKDSLQRPEE
jgi:hypothetical protein